jgi:hypothetical protein
MWTWRRFWNIGFFQSTLTRNSLVCTSKCAHGTHLYTSYNVVARCFTLHTKECKCNKICYKYIINVTQLLHQVLRWTVDGLNDFTCEPLTSWSRL